MTPVRWFLVGFWVFVVGGLAWQAYTSQTTAEKESAEHPQPEHYFFDPKMDAQQAALDRANNHPNANAAPRSTVPMADVRQVNYWTTSENSSTFVSHVLLRNDGNAKATGVQIWVRPYRGVILGDDGGGARNAPHPLPETDPRAQYGQWLSAPDLGPGESCTQTVTFVSQPGIDRGINPHPQITFQTETPDQAKSNP